MQKVEASLVYLKNKKKASVLWPGGGEGVWQDTGWEGREKRAV